MNSLINRLRISRRAAWLRRALGVREPDMQTVFSLIHDDNLWADPESRSGRGSTLARTNAIRAALPELLRELRADSLLDAACGDFNWMSRIDLGGVRYVGVDVVPALIEANRLRHGRGDREFVVADITRDPLPAADVILCRDCLIHLSFASARAAVANFKRSGSRLLLATTHDSVRKNIDIQDGSWRSVNLRLPPFNFPPPARVLVEDESVGKCLGAWPLEGL